MQNLTEKECLDAIHNERCFHANILDGSFSIKIEEYSFFICTAIHNGSRLRREISKKCLLSAKERLYEEDPYTGEFISAMPISIIANDSRYEYDLNRPREACIYDEAWGKKVWGDSLTKDEREKSIQKHVVFYRILAALIEKLEEKHGACLVYDVHSYNYQRIKDTTPLFNIGTEQLDTARWYEAITHWEKTLNDCSLAHMGCKAELNTVFKGRGYLVTFIVEHFNNCLVLPTEIKKIFMDEKSGDVYHLVLSELKECIKQMVVEHAFFFSNRYTRRRRKSKTVLLSSKIEPAVLKIDKKLYRLCKGIETLLYINPKNLIGERKRFYAKNYNYNPKFTYRHLDINPSFYREKLYRLPVDKITDISIQNLYRDVINSWSTKIDLMAAVGTEKFLYNSLLYYGEPQEEDIKVAHFLIFAKKFEVFEKPSMPSSTAKEKFLTAVKQYGIRCKVEETNKIIASAMVNNARKTILLNSGKLFNETQINALIHHELGVHMVTTANSDLQNLKVFKLGLPGNTYTQEGLAVLSEYMSGHLNLTRLKTLALRVIAVRMMVKNYDFSRTFKILRGDFNIDREEAFQITARVFRGGGFTKDFLYLRGLRDALRLYESHDLHCLFIGKTSFDYMDVISEMIERKMASKPNFLPQFLKSNSKFIPNPILDYLINSVY